MTETFPIVILISGRGSNMRSLLEQASGYSVAAVISNREAPGLEFARQAGIPALVRKRKSGETKLEQQQAIFELAKQYSPALIVLAGFMQILEPSITREWRGRLVNIHPSLLPEFPGLDTHERAITAGASHHGCTVHFVDDGVDTGPKIAQMRCEITPDDTPETLAARVLTLEHRIFPWTIRAIATGDIEFSGELVRYSTACAADAAAQGIDLPGAARKL